MVELPTTFNVLLADDGSEGSLAAIQMLSDLTFPPGSQVTVLGVLMPRNTTNHALLQAVLNKTQLMLEERGFIVENILQLGYPVEQIVAYAQKKNVDLILMGAKGLRATPAILLGGVAQGVVEHSAKPVMVVRPPYQGVKRVLLATDGSPTSQAAVKYLCTGESCTGFWLPHQAQVEVIHVLPPALINREAILQTRWIGPEVLPYLPEYSEEELAAQAEREEGEGRALVESIAEILKGAAVNANGVVRRGDAATEILNYARERNVDLLIAGSRGLGGMQGWLQGSVSRKLLHYAHCSTLVVHK